MNDLSEDQMILSIEDWPCVSVLPVKQSVMRGWPKTGILIASEIVGQRDNNTPFSVYMTNMYTLESGPPAPQLADTEKVTFKSIPDFLAQGWIVD